jgi:hypothetical protein
MSRAGIESPIATSSFQGRREAFGRILSLSATRMRSIQISPA